MPGERTIAADLAIRMTSSTFGNLAADALKAPLFDFLGLNGADSFTTYLQTIERHLQSMSAQLVNIQQGIQQILIGIASLHQQIADVSVQNALQHFNDNANIIKENFRTYNDGVVGLQSTDVNQRHDGAKTLYDLFGTINATNISIALRNVEDSFLSSLSEMKGLLDYQHTVVASSTIGPASDSSRYYVGDLCGLPSPGGAWACSQIVELTHGTAYNTLNSTVANTFKAFITVASQGLIFLRAAWGNSIHESRLQDHIDRINAVLAGMRAFPTAVFSTIDAQTSANLRTYGKYLLPRAASNDIRWDFGAGNVQMQYPLSNDWIMWRWPGRYAGGCQFLMIERPWNHATCRTALIQYDASQDHIFCFITGELGGWPADYVPFYDTGHQIPPGLRFVEKL